MGDNLLVKLADFGLSRLLKVEDLYTAREGAKFPIKVRLPGGFCVLVAFLTSFCCLSCHGLPATSLFSSTRFHIAIDDGRNLCRPAPSSPSITLRPPFPLPHPAVDGARVAQLQRLHHQV